VLKISKVPLYLLDSVGKIVKINIKPKELSELLSKKLKKIRGGSTVCIITNRLPHYEKI
jgi:hypothetical protein